MEQHVIGMIVMSVMFLAMVVVGAMVLFTKTGQHNPNAKHYCAMCNKLEHECNCNSC